MEVLYGGLLTEMVLSLFTFAEMKSHFSRKVRSNDNGNVNTFQRPERKEELWKILISFLWKYGVWIIHSLSFLLPMDSQYRYFCLSLFEFSFKGYLQLLFILNIIVWATEAMMNKYLVNMNSVIRIHHFWASTWTDSCSIIYMEYHLTP